MEVWKVLWMTVLMMFTPKLQLSPSSFANAQINLPTKLGRDRVCPPHTPLPVNDTYDIAECRREAGATMQLKDPYADKRTNETILDHGYSLETHRVTSRDGYITTIYRIPGGQKSPPRAGKPSVLLFHGLGSVSDAWFALPANKNLAFKLADDGYDVWLANGRGADESKGHMSLDSEEDLDYWDFSFHEMGVYDLPAIVDLMLEQSRNEKIFYVGISQGGTVYLAGASDVPELNDKIHASFLMAPAAFMGGAYIRSFTMWLPLLYNPLETLVYRLFGGRLEQRSPRNFLTTLGIEPVDICSVRAFQCDLCDSAFFTLFEFNPHQTNYTNTPNLLKMLNTANLKSYIHFGQNILSCEFRKYDYGRLENLVRYGRFEPPTYPLGNLRAPLYIFYGEQDSFIPPPDMQRLANAINPQALKGFYRVDDDTWDHADFQIGKDADRLVYDRVMGLMKEYL